MHSFFSNAEESGLSRHKTLTSNKIRIQRDSLRVFQGHGYEFEKELTYYEKSSNKDCGSGLLLYVISTINYKLAFDSFQKFLLSNTKVIQKMIGARPYFCMISYTPHNCSKIWIVSSL